MDLFTDIRSTSSDLRESGSQRLNVSIISGTLAYILRRRCRAGAIQRARLQHGAAQQSVLLPGEPKQAVGAVVGTDLHLLTGEGEGVRARVRVRVCSEAERAGEVAGGGQARARVRADLVAGARVEHCRDDRPSSVEDARNLWDERVMSVG